MAPSTRHHSSEKACFEEGKAEAVGYLVGDLHRRARAYVPLQWGDLRLEGRRGRVEKGGTRY